jgi:hypothetical protein
VVSRMLARKEKSIGGIVSGWFGMRALMPAIEATAA